MSKGTDLTQALRKAHHIGARTRWLRDGWTGDGSHRLRENIRERIDTAVDYPGSYPAAETEAVKPAIQAVE